MNVRVQGTSSDQREHSFWRQLPGLTAVMFDVPPREVSVNFEEGPVGDIGIFVEGQKTNIEPESKELFKKKTREALSCFGVSVSVVCKVA